MTQYDKAFNDSANFLAIVFVLALVGVVGYVAYLFISIFILG